MRRSKPPLPSLPPLSSSNPIEPRQSPRPTRPRRRDRRRRRRDMEAMGDAITAVRSLLIRSSAARSLRIRSLRVRGRDAQTPHRTLHWVRQAQNRRSSLSGNGGGDSCEVEQSDENWIDECKIHRV